MHIKSHKKSHKSHAKTYKRQPIHGKIVSDHQEGWKILHVYGEPYQRGFAHGYLLKRELARTKKVLLFLLKHELNVSYREYIRTSNRLIKPAVKQRYPELYDEMRGISAGGDISLDFIVAWNAYMSLYSYYKDGAVIKCSAFIATGDATKHGDIVMGHNTHCDFACGQLQNIVMYVFPSQGSSFVMQTAPGYVCSGTDWFICSTGIIGCETTISGINYKPVFGDPYFCRIRHAMQYGKTLDDYDTIMTTRNAGDYAGSWQFGDVNTGEIMLFEIALKEKNVKRTKNGVFFGTNSAMGENIRKKETTDIDHENITTSVGARYHRFRELVGNGSETRVGKYYGKITAENAKTILADHHDPYMKREQLGMRGICKHVESSDEHCNRPPHSLFGCVDAKTTNSEMARRLAFNGRFGSACGRVFSIREHIKKYPDFKEWESVVDDIPSHKWCKIDL